MPPKWEGIKNMIMTINGQEVGKVVGINSDVDPLSGDVEGIKNLIGNIGKEDFTVEGSLMINNGDAAYSSIDREDIKQIIKEELVQTKEYNKILNEHVITIINKQNDIINKLIERITKLENGD